METPETWTLEDATGYLQQWLKASQALATGQSYTIGTRKLERTDSDHVNERITFWRAEVTRLTRRRRPGIRLQRIIPRDY